MAQSSSFDVVSEVDLQEVDNALNQVRKEISQRYDFKDSKSSIEFLQKDKKIIVISDDDFKLKSVLDILQTKMIKRGVPIKSLKYNAVQPAANSTVRQEISLRVGIEKEDAKTIVKIIKDARIKVQAQIMDDQVRVTGKDKDDLQEVIKLLRGTDFPFAMQFVNYR